MNSTRISSSSSTSRVDKRVKALSKLASEFVEVDGNGIVIGLFRRSGLLRAQQRGDFADRARQRLHGTAAAVGFAAARRLYGAEHAIDGREVIMQKAIKAKREIDARGFEQLGIDRLDDGRDGEGIDRLRSHLRQGLREV